MTLLFRRSLKQDPKVSRLHKKVLVECVYLAYLCQDFGGLLAKRQLCSARTSIVYLAATPSVPRGHEDQHVI